MSKETEDLLTCDIELQLDSKPEDVNALTSPSYCYTLDKGFCLVKNLVIKREKKSKILSISSIVFWLHKSVCHPWKYSKYLKHVYYKEDSRLYLNKILEITKWNSNTADIIIWNTYKLQNTINYSYFLNVISIFRTMFRYFYKLYQLYFIWVQNLDACLV